VRRASVDAVSAAPGPATGPIRAIVPLASNYLEFDLYRSEPGLPNEIGPVAARMVPFESNYLEFGFYRREPGLPTEVSWPGHPRDGSA
jgi:hypothetical protein